MLFANRGGTSVYFASKEGTLAHFAPKGAPQSMFFQTSGHFKCALLLEEGTQLCVFISSFIGYIVLISQKRKISEVCQQEGHFAYFMLCAYFGSLEYETVWHLWSLYNVLLLLRGHFSRSFIFKEENLAAIHHTLKLVIS